jgi:hypothetical protein
MAKRTIDHSGRDVPRKLDVQDEPKQKPGSFTVTVTDSNGIQVGYARVRWGDDKCFRLGKDGRLIPVPGQNQAAVIPRDSLTEGQVER